MKTYGELTSPTMTTFMGREIDPLNITIRDLHIMDIAHALSNICRYGGHCHQFYSVGTHSYLLSLAVEPEFAPWALLHDATEAYLGDMIRPLKAVMPDYWAAEARLAETIADRFGLPWPMPVQVKEGDLRMAITEKKYLLPLSEPWPMEADYQPFDFFEGAFSSMPSPENMREIFLLRFEELFV